MQTIKKIMKKCFLFIILCTAIIALASCHKDEKQVEKAKAVDTIPQLIMQVKKCSRLYTAELKVHKIVTHGDDVRIKGKFLNQEYNVALPVGTRRIAIPMDATLKAYVDFSDFSKNNITRNGNKLEITLPDPRIELSSTRICHNEIKTYVALFRKNFSDAELSSYEKQGRTAIIESIGDTGIIEMARESAAKTIVPLFAAMGFEEKDITVTFRKDFSQSDISKLVQEAKR